MIDLTGRSGRPDDASDDTTETSAVPEPAYARLARLEERIASHEKRSDDRHHVVVDDLDDLGERIDGLGRRVSALGDRITAVGENAREAIDAHAVETRAKLDQLGDRIWKLAILIAVGSGATSFGVD